MFKSLRPQQTLLMEKSWWKGSLIFYPQSSHVYSICLILFPLDWETVTSPKKRPVSWPIPSKTRSTYAIVRLCSRSKLMLSWILDLPELPSPGTWPLQNRAWVGPSAPSLGRWQVEASRYKSLQSHQKTKQDCLELWSLQNVFGSVVIGELAPHPSFWVRENKTKHKKPW